MGTAPNFAALAKLGVCPIFAPRNTADAQPYSVSPNPKCAANTGSNFSPFPSLPPRRKYSRAN